MGDGGGVAVTVMTARTFRVRAVPAAALRSFDMSDDREPPAEALSTITDVSRACGLAQPAIAQLVSRTWTARGWMYTADQVAEAIVLAAQLKDRRLT